MITKKEMIQNIYKCYGILLPEKTEEKILLDVLSGKFNSIEISNIAKHGKADKYDAETLKSIPINDLRKIAFKQSRRIIPPEASRDILIKIITKKLNSKKMTDQELMMFGKHSQSPVLGALKLYGGFIPKVKRVINKKDLQKGKRVVKYYK